MYIVTVVLGGLAGIIAMVACVYLVAVLIDWLPCLNASQYILTPQELEERRVASELIKRAGLAGMLTNEKQQAVKHFFQNQSYPFHKVVEDEKGQEDVDDIEAQHETAPDDPPSNEDEKSLNENLPKEAAPVVFLAETHSKTENDDSASDVDEGTCSICLSAYENGDRVLVGSSCSHMFHFACCMQWMEKEEHCPYCREEMLTAEELFQAARETLGEERVTKLKTINDEAAKRVAAFIAAQREGVGVDATRGHAATMPSSATQDTAQEDGRNGESPVTLSDQQEESTKYSRQPSEAEDIETGRCSKINGAESGDKEKPENIGGSASDETGSFVDAAKVGDSEQSEEPEVDSSNGTSGPETENVALSWKLTNNEGTEEDHAAVDEEKVEVPAGATSDAKNRAMNDDACTKSELDSSTLRSNKDDEETQQEEATNEDGISAPGLDSGPQEDPAIPVLVIEAAAVSSGNDEEDCEDESEIDC